MSKSAKHGEAREQYLNSNSPMTVTVFNESFGGDMMVVNEDQFDPKTMKRCNSLGQLVDEKGRVYQESMPKQNTAPEPKPNGGEQAKSESKASK